MMGGNGSEGIVGASLDGYISCCHLEEGDRRRFAKYLMKSKTMTQPRSSLFVENRPLYAVLGPKAHS